MSVLLFHRVTDEIPEDGLTVGTRRFRRICRMLQRGFNVVPLAEVFRLLKASEPIPPRTVAITFDDCYRDNLHAAHVLAEHGLPASFFVPTGFVGTDHQFPWDRDKPRLANLSWADVREMAQLGFNIGSHTVTHANLAEVPLDQMRWELAKSKATLEDKLGQPARYLAYPFGLRQFFALDRLPVVHEAGYEGCLSGFGGFIHRESSGNDRETAAQLPMLPREPVPYIESILHLELHLTGCLNWYYNLKRTAREERSAPEAALCPP